MKTDLAYQLSDLSDVNTSTPTNRFALIADGTDFESRALVEADISDLGTYLTDITGQSILSLSDVAADPNADKYLMWDDSASTCTWQDAGAGGGYTNLTSFVDQTAWRLFYSNTAGDVTELALGTDGQVLTSAGVDIAPAFEDAAGGGDALTTDPLSQFAATTSAELAGVISDEKGAGALVFETLLAKLFPNIYNRDIKWLLKEPYTTAANRYTIQTPNDMSVDIDGAIYFIETQSDIDLSVEANWDTIAVDYRVAATRAGKDFYIYACQPASGDAPVIKLRANSTVPTDYTAGNSRKIRWLPLSLCSSRGYSWTYFR